jgi:hypothetical protein
MPGITIINERLIYLPYAKDSKVYIARIEAELKIFNDARAGQDSEEMLILKRMNDTLDKALRKEG